MPLPIFIAIGVAIAAGTASSKGSSAIREHYNKNTTIIIKCPYCSSSGPHKFKEIRNSWTSSGVVGGLTGIIGGTVKGLTAESLYSCFRCKQLLTKKGTKPSWYMDQAVSDSARVFFSNKSIKDQYDELQNLIAREQTISKRYYYQIQHLEDELSNAKSSEEDIRRKLSMIIDKIRTESSKK
jgi:hypothetical protein